MSKRTVSKALRTLLLSLILSFTIVSPAWAKDSKVIYNGKADRFVFIPKDTDLFQNFKGVMPGDAISQKITVSNTAKTSGELKIYLRAEAVDKKYEDFLSQLRLKVVQDDTAELFEAASSEQAGLAENVLLGSFKQGAKVELVATLDVPIDMNNEYQNALGEIIWVFTAEEIYYEDQENEVPKTGDETNVVYYLVLGVASLVVVSILVYKDAKKKKTS